LGTEVGHFSPAAVNLRSYAPDDLADILALTIATFEPFYEDSFRLAVSEKIFAHQHGNWRGDYGVQVSGLHDPTNNKYVTVAEWEGSITGYIAWTVDPMRRHGEIDIIAVSSDHRGQHVGTALCQHACAHMRQAGAEVVELGTGGDWFHAPARAMYENLGFTHFPTAVYIKEL
jgi:ribosomal protein S18 acetylase RimI-like enzyme